MPAHVPSSIFETYVACCSGVPKWRITSAAPCVSAGYMLNDVHDPHMNSSTITESVNGPA